MYTIKNKGRYVKQHCFSGSSFTRDINQAVKYATKEEALKNACGNEQIVEIYQSGYSENRYQ